MYSVSPLCLLYLGLCNRNVSADINSIHSFSPSSHDSSKKCDKVFTFSTVVIFRGKKINFSAVRKERA